MKSKSKPKQKEKPSAQEQPKPAIDEILTISRDEGRATLELKKDDAPKDDIKTEPAQAPAEKKEPVFRLPKKPKSIIPTKAPKQTSRNQLRWCAPSPERTRLRQLPASQAAGKLLPAKIAKPAKKTKTAKKARQQEKPFNAPALKDSFMFSGEVAAESRKEARLVPPENCSRPEVWRMPAEASKQAVAEAALFLSPKPLMLDELARIMGVSSLGYVKETLEKLAKDYEGRGLEIVSSPAGWEMQVRPQHLGPVAHLAPYADLSEGQKRTLALILFKEPLKQSDLIKMQGNKVYDYLRNLEKLGMIARKPHGRTKLLSLTKEFERYFGEEKSRVKERLSQELANVRMPESVVAKKDSKTGIDAGLSGDE
jgi:segregation and condensation protein B